MAKEKFVLVSLKESKAKQLAQVIANESCRRILDYLSENEATETELSKKLNIPISTVHYNLKHLIEGGLVAVDEFHYSEKGKEINHYKLANKYIIIAPKSTFGIKEKLKTILPVALLIGAVAWFIQVFSKYFVRGEFTERLTTVTKTIGTEVVMEAERASAEAPAVAKSVTTSSVATGTSAVVDTAKEEAVTEVESFLVERAPEIVQNATNVTTETITNTIPPSPWANIALWFLIGAVSAIFLYLIVSKMIEKR